MPDKTRVLESKSKHGQLPMLQAQPKNSSPIRDAFLPPLRQDVPLTRELILRLIEMIKQV